MHANNLAIGRNHYTAESGFLTAGADWFRVTLKWSDGAEVYAIYDTKQEAIAHLNRLGFFQ